MSQSHSYLTQARYVHDRVTELVRKPNADHGVDVAKCQLLMAGMLVEVITGPEEDEPPEALLQSSFSRLAGKLGCGWPSWHMLAVEGEPEPQWPQIDTEGEKGRALAAEIMMLLGLESAEMREIVLSLIASTMTSWEQEGWPRAETFAHFAHCAAASLAFDRVADKMNDYVIEEPLDKGGWRIAEAVSGLAGLAGSWLAQSHLQAKRPLNESWLAFDQTSAVMMSEAVRLGVPAGSDWRRGVPANDEGGGAPLGLTAELCAPLQEFAEPWYIFDDCPAAMAVAASKAAGRFLAVVCAAEEVDPHIPPAIAKSLALGAMDACFKSLLRRGL